MTDRKAASFIAVSSYIWALVTMHERAVFSTVLKSIKNLPAAGLDSSPSRLFIDAEGSGTPEAECEDDTASIRMRSACAADVGIKQAAVLRTLRTARSRRSPREGGARPRSMPPASGPTPYAAPAIVISISPAGER